MIAVGNRPIGYLVTTKAGVLCNQDFRPSLLVSPMTPVTVRGGQTGTIESALFLVVLLTIKKSPTVSTGEQLAIANCFSNGVAQ